MFLCTADISISFLVSSPPSLQSFCQADQQQLLFGIHSLSLSSKTAVCFFRVASLVCFPQAICFHILNAWATLIMVSDNLTNFFPLKRIHMLDLPKQSNVSSASIPICFTPQIMKAAPVAKYWTMKKTHKNVKGPCIIQVALRQTCGEQTLSHLTQTTR